MGAGRGNVEGIRGRVKYIALTHEGQMEQETGDRIV
jgi:hypothetical protein